MRLFALALSLFSLPGCIGSMAILGLDPTAGDDDDDSDNPLVLDFSSYEGTEYLNIAWADEQHDQGYVDCIEDGPWDASGADTTQSDANLCPSCTYVWTISLDPSPEVESCLAGTGNPAEPLSRRLGFQIQDDTNFLVFRNKGSVNNALSSIGIGAFDGSDFTWSGAADFRSQSEDGRYEYYFSGEGGF